MAFAAWRFSNWIFRRLTKLCNIYFPPSFSLFLSLSRKISSTIEINFSKHSKGCSISLTRINRARINVIWIELVAISFERNLKWLREGLDEESVPWTERKKRSGKAREKSMGENAERNNISEDINHGENISQGAVKMRHCFIARRKKKKKKGLINEPVWNIAPPTSSTKIFRDISHYHTTIKPDFPCESSVDTFFSNY